VTYRLTYIETGMGFVGWDSYDGEYFDEDYVEHGQDSDRYWEMAGEEFGIEPDEAPKYEPDDGPLTDEQVAQIKEAVKDRGLTT
jgi:hypothetical protein